MRVRMSGCMRSECSAHIVRSICRGSATGARVTRDTTTGERWWRSGAQEGTARQSGVATCIHEPDYYVMLYFAMLREGQAIIDNSDFLTAGEALLAHYDGDRRLLRPSSGTLNGR